MANNKTTSDIEVSGVTIIPVAVNPTWGTASTIFEDIARMTETAGNTGTSDYFTYGLEVTTGATGTSFTELSLEFANANVVEANDATFSGTYMLWESGTDYEHFLGVGNLATSGTAITFTGNQFGFKVTRASSGTEAYSATNSDGTETATAITAFSTETIYAQKNDTTNIKFYAAQTLEATHTTNIDAGDLVSALFYAASNVTVASAATFRTVYGCYTERASAD